MTPQIESPQGSSQRAGEEIPKSSTTNYTSTKPWPPYSRKLSKQRKKLGIVYGWPRNGFRPSPDVVVLPEGKAPSEFYWGFVAGCHCFVAPTIEPARIPVPIPQDTARELAERLVAAGALSVLVFGTEFKNGELQHIHWWPPELVPDKAGGQW